jgi:PAS domain S-box-containing protein
MKRISPAFRIALIDAVIGTLWIMLSDTIVNALVSDMDTRASIQTYKGAAYIVITAGLVFFMVQDYTRRQNKVERELKRSQRRYRDIVEDQTEMICRQGIDGKLTFVNPALCHVFKKGPEDLLDRPFANLIPENDQGHLAELLQSLTEEDPVNDIEHRIAGSMGDSYHHWTHRMILDEGGAVVEYQSTGRDVTEERLAAKRQASLVYELDHRVKNNLAVVSSLVKETMRSSKTMEEFTETLNGRIRAISLTHETLSQKRWKGNVKIPAPVTQPLGLAINELATNSVKYGALSTPGGSIKVSWSCDEHNRVTLNWVESGGPVIEPPVTHGVGLGIVTGLIEYELNGSIEMEFYPTGLRGLIIFSIASRD